MAYNKEQFRLAIEVVLAELGAHSESAVDLLMLTAAQESHLGTYLRQVGGGPALGTFQMEPATHADIWQNYLAYHQVRRDRVVRLKSSMGYEWDMVYNLGYQIAMTRVHYLRFPEKLPVRDNYSSDYYYVHALATYWKKYYNTEKGRGKIKEAIDNYRGFVSDDLQEV